MDLLSKKIDYRSQAEKDYQTAVFNYKQMFRSSPEHLKVITTLEKLCENSENKIRTAKIKAKPPGRKYRVVKKSRQQLISAEEKEKQMIKTALLRQEGKRVARAMKERLRIQSETEDKRVLPTREINHRELIPVKIDAKTTIYVKPGVDPILAKKNFIEKHSRAKDPAELKASGEKATDYQVWLTRVKDLARKKDVAISKYHLDFFQAKFRESVSAPQALKMYVDQMTL